MTRARNLANRASDIVSVKDSPFGAVGDGITDDTAAIQAAINENTRLYFPAGTYKISSGLTVNKPMQIFGAGVKTLIRNTNTSGQHTLLIDGTGVANGMTGVIVSDIALSSEPGGGDALRLVNIYRSVFSNVLIPSCAVSAVRLLGSGHNTLIAITITTNFGYSGVFASAQFGISLQDNPTTLLSSGHNTFIDPRVEGMTSAVAYRLLGSSSHNTFINGDGVVCAQALNIATDATLNSFYGTVFEDNSTIDIQCSGQFNRFVNVQAFSIANGGAAGKIQFLSGASNNVIDGGRFRVIQVDSGVNGTVIGGGASTFTGIVDNGTGTQIGEIWEITNQKYLQQAITMPATSGPDGGMLTVRDSADKRRRISFGFDRTILTAGAGYVYAIHDGIANVPLMLNPGAGGKVAIGQTSADQGGTNNLAMAPGSAPSVNHTGITLFTIDGLTLKFMDKNGVIRSITFT
jgi:hypothetical protein